MKAKDLMTREVLSIDKDDRLEQALVLMRKHRVSKLVVVDKGRVVGVLVDGDIADELGAIKNRGVPATHLHVTSAMRRTFPVATAETDVHEVLRMLAEDDVHLVTVLHDQTPVGVITASDVLRLVRSTATLAEVMTPRLEVVAPSDRVIHARRIMLDHGISHLPVLAEGKLVGLVSEIDLALGFARFKETVADRHQPAAILRFLVEDVMNRNLVTAEPETTAEAAARMMLDEDVGSLPVLRNGRLVGIATRGDLLKLVRSEPR